VKTGTTVELLPVPVTGVVVEEIDVWRYKRPHKERNLPPARCYNNNNNKNSTMVWKAHAFGKSGRIVFQPIHRRNVCVETLWMT
jgi:hypothetical protein